MKKTKKERNNGKWTEAQFRSWIVSILRKGSMRWGPKGEALRKARVSRGKYLCAGCKKVVPSSKLIEGKRVKNVFADHIHPVVDPTEGFTTWDNFISRLFVEEDGYQILCADCHSKKTEEERLIAKERKSK